MISCFKNSLNLLLKKQNFFLYEKKNEINVNVKNENLLNIFLFLKNAESCQFKILIDIVGVDFKTKKNRFCINYCLLSLKYNIRLNVKIYVKSLNFVNSITKIYKNACWLEREVWDSFGIYFDGNPDLRRILTDYGFEGHFLRKDFPLSGFLETRFDDTQKRVIFEHIEMTQEYRFYNYKSVWYNF